MHSNAMESFEPCLNMRLVFSPWVIDVVVTWIRGLNEITNCIFVVLYLFAV